MSNKLVRFNHVFHFNIRRNKRCDENQRKTRETHRQPTNQRQRKNKPEAYKTNLTFAACSHVVCSPSDHSARSLPSRTSSRAASNWDTLEFIDVKVCQTILIAFLRSFSEVTVFKVLVNQRLTAIYVLQITGFIF